MLDYLVIAPHPDDAELAAGGAILSLKARGAKVGILDLTDGEPTPHGSLAIRERETQAATAILGVDWRGNLGLKNRFLEADMASRHKLAAKLREVRPRILLAPYWEDAHPDHVSASVLIAARSTGRATSAPDPSPSRIFRSSNGSRPRRFNARMCAGSVDRCAACIHRTIRGLADCATRAAAVTTRPSSSTGARR